MERKIKKAWWARMTILDGLSLKKMLELRKYAPKDYFLFKGMSGIYFNQRLTRETAWINDSQYELIRKKMQPKAIHAFQSVLYRMSVGETGEVI